MGNMYEKAGNCFRRLLVVLSKICNILKDDGARKGAWRIARESYWRIMRASLDICDRFFDSRYHVQTSRQEELSALTVFDGNKECGTRYEPTPVSVFPFLLANLPRDLSEYVFVDFGAGRGRAVLLASHYGFKKIIGVEFADELCVAMRNNIRRYRNPAQRCFDIDVVCMDAARFSIPSDKCVLFFYNPFDKTILEKIVQNIELSYISKPRELYVVFYNPNTKNCADELLGESATFRKTSSRIRDPRFVLLSRWSVVTYKSDELRLIDARDMGAVL